MKTISILLMLFIGFVNTEVQNEVTTNAVYDGYLEGVYTFTIEGSDEYIGETIEFDKIPDAILKKYDLESEGFEGQHFSITYIEKIEKMEDEYGEEVEWTIYELKSLNKI